ncbi:MAG TPA: magnesium/cobalt transporter CorA, partial [Geoalkalibacter subterraneus]|nr:magnesium/cobalt transporter CorA [Geoalkalibacter subterraneus]
RDYPDAASCLPLRDTDSISWINVEGLHQVEVIETLGQGFGLHPLVLEDILNTDQRPKVEIYDDYIFIVVKMLLYDTEHEGVRTEQVSLVLGKNFVISFQECHGDVFDGVRERLRHGRRIRFLGSDYLAYALIDAIVDSHFFILEKIGEEIEQLEDELLADPSPESLNQIHRLRREMILLRKSVWPLRELVSELSREDTPMVSRETGVFLRDVYDHCIQVIDTVETFRDLLGGMLDLYMSNVSNRMNEVMKVLTLIATIFIPLTFIAGVYGMNFEYMPELSWKWAYPAVWGIMIGVGIGLVFLFKKKNWL